MTSKTKVEWEYHPYTIADAKERAASARERKDTIEWTEELRGLVEGLAMPADFKRTFSRFNGAPQPTDLIQRSWITLLNHALPNFWIAAVGSNTEGDLPAGFNARMRIGHADWAALWKPTAQKLPDDSLQEVIRRIFIWEFASLRDSAPGPAGVAALMGGSRDLLSICQTVTMVNLAVCGKVPVLHRDGIADPDLTRKALQEAGIEFTDNVLRIDHPLKLRQHPSWDTLQNWLVCGSCKALTPRHKCWVMYVSTFRDMRGPGQHDGLMGIPFRAWCWLCGVREQDSLPPLGITTGMAQRERLIARSIGANPSEGADPVRVIARQYGLTVEDAHRMLSRQSDGPQSEAAYSAICPLASRCHTYCAELQTKGYPMAFTWDGRWQSCEYGEHIGTELADSAEDDQATPEFQVETLVPLAEIEPANQTAQLTLF